jgi:hypothetical protein
MNRWIPISALSFCLAAAACGGGNQAGPAAKDTGPAAKDTSPAGDQSDGNAMFGPLEVGADWQSYTRVNTEPVPSEDHGGRFVDTWVNDAGLAAYKSPDTPMPVGSVVVKTSWETKDGQPTTTPGPIFVMEKRAAGYDDENENWYYAIHWAEPSPKMREKFGPIYWRSPSAKVKYCYDCHNGYDRQLGMVPEGKRAW